MRPTRHRDQPAASTQSALRAIATGAEGWFKVPIRKSDCRDCALRVKCVRHPDRTVERQVALFIGRSKGKAETHCARMKRKIDSELGRYRYSRRLGIVEPVFANIRSTHRLDRFSHRGRRKVTTQWQLYCLVHNIGKVQRYAQLGTS